MPMMNRKSGSLYLIAVAGLVGMLVLGGCAMKTVTATTSGEEAASAPAPQDKTVVEAPPTVVAKADEKEIEVRKTQEATQKDLANIYFAFDKWALTAEGKKNLTQSAEALKQDPTAKLLIEGHCDERGSREYNLVLGEKRAKAAQGFLLSLGVTNPITVTSYGKERPVCTEHKESCYWKNRRAHLVLEGVSGK